jgi:hypothetical protein
LALKGMLWQTWACPCAPEELRRAAAGIRVQQGLREKVDEGLQRAQALLPHILAILQEHDVPVELAALPLVESTYNPQAYSKAGAVGLWQFIRSTGKRYLTITRARDDRRDPLRATKAAARLLRHNYEALGSWPLAIVAYNHGREGVLTARASVGSSAIEDIIARYTGPALALLPRTSTRVPGRSEGRPTLAQRPGTHREAGTVSDASSAAISVRARRSPHPPPGALGPAAVVEAEPPIKAALPLMDQAPAERAPNPGGTPVPFGIPAANEHVGGRPKNTELDTPFAKSTRVTRVLRAPRRRPCGADPAPHRPPRPVRQAVLVYDIEE